MKKIFLYTFVVVLLLLNNSNISANVVDENFKSYNQEASVFVPILKTDKVLYNVGESIKGEVYIDNNSDFRQSDLYLVTSVVLVNDKGRNELEYIKNPDDIYLESKSRKKIEFTHTIKTNVNENVEFVATVYAKDGSILGQKKVPVKISSENPVKIIDIKNIFLQQGKVNFSPGIGVTVKRNEDVFLKFTTNTLPNEKIKIKPIISIYNRSNIQSNPIKQIEVDEIILESNKDYLIEIPTDLDPLVYFGKVSFDISGYALSAIDFRYIIEGKIGSILNLNSSNLDVDKDETVQIRIEYAGQPGVVNSQTVENESEISTTSVPVVEDLNDLENTQTDAYINITLIDQDNNVIGQSRVDIDLSKSGIEIADVTVNKKTKGFIIKAEMFSNEGILLSEYSTDLPSESELKKEYGKTMFSVVDYIILSAILIFLIIMFFVYKKFKTRKVLFVLVLNAALLISFLVYVVNVKAFTYHFNPVANGSTYFKVNSIISPGPAESVSYAPGEVFDLNLNASYVACSNAGFENSLYGPSQDWSNFNFDYNSVSSLFNLQELKDRNQLRATVVHTNVMNNTGDGWISNIVRFAEWWTGKGVLSGVPYITPGKYTTSSFLFNQYASSTYEFYQGYQLVDQLPRPDLHVGLTNQNNVTGKGGVLLFQTNKWGQDVLGVGSGDKSSNYNINSGAVTYKMPQEPGFHDFYFMLTNRARGHTAATKIVSQRVCVRGAGVCINEEDPADICPNLTGNFRQAEGVIQQQNQSTWVDTEYIKNDSGQCVVGPHSLTASANPSETSAIINWEYANVLGQKNYEIQLSENSNMTSILKTNTGGADDRSSVFNGLATNTTYYARIRVNNGISWSNYVNVTFTTVSPDQCSCSGRDLICANGQPTTNSSQCRFSLYCGASFVGEDAVFNLVNRNTIGTNIRYVYSGNTTTQSKETPYTITKPKVSGMNTIYFSATDLGDNSEHSSSCSIDNTDGESDNSTSTPSIVMSKNGSCNISWNIQNMPEATTCTLTGGSNSIPLTQLQGSQNFGPVQSNTKYTITCSGEGLSTPIASSVICRVDPTLTEN